MKKNKIAGLILATIFMATSVAQFAYIQTTFLNQYFSLEFISIIFFVSYLITFFAINEYPKLIAKFGNLKTTIAAALGQIASLLIFTYTGDTAWLFFGTILYIIATNLVAINFDIFLEAYTTNAATGKIRGIYYTIYNLGYLISPLAAGLILDKYGFNKIFSLIIILTLIFMIVMIFAFYNFKIQHVAKHFNLKRTYRAIFADRNIKNIFFIAFLLQIFYAAMVMYMPIYLNQTMGFSWPQIGLIFTIMLLPFVLLQYPAGFLADKYFGEKEIMTIGLILMIIATIGVFFIETPNLWIFALVLFLSRVGASLVEIMRDTYFFKKVDAENIDLINAFRSTTPLAYLIAPIAVTVILNWLAFNYIFLILGLFLTSGLTFTLAIKDTK